MGKKRPVGRPRVEIDMEQVKKLCQLHCTQDEICGFLEISDETLKARLRECGFENFLDCYKKHSAGGKISLRRNQFKMSETNAAMAIWLGKQHLDQRDMTYDPAGTQIDRPAMFLESLQFIAETLKEINPEALRLLSRHFDTLVGKFKQAIEP